MMDAAILSERGAPKCALARQREGRWIGKALSVLLAICVMALGLSPDAASARLRGHRHGAPLEELPANAAIPATPVLLMDAETGAVLYRQNANAPWYPASLTKLMTIYVALDAVRQGRVRLDTPFVVSRRATAQAPSKMGFEAGTEVTLDNALKMLVVKSANDIAVMVAEGLSGSVDDFAHEMNGAAARLGMRQSFFVNPNGLPDVRQTMSAADLALLARALVTEFPNTRGLFALPAMGFNGAIIPSHNGMIGHFEGADGMKTGFTCAAGFNLVASATRGSRTLVAIVMGAASAKSRNVLAGELLAYGFDGLFAPIDSLDALAAQVPVNATPVDMRPFVCGKGAMRRRVEEAAKSAPTLVEARARYAQTHGALAYEALEMDLTRGGRVLTDATPVFIGPVPGWTGDVLHARGEEIPPQPAPQLATAPAAPPTTASTAPASMPPSASLAPLPPRGKAGAARVRSAVNKAQGKAQDKTQDIMVQGDSNAPISLVAKPLSSPIAGALGLPLGTRFAPVASKAGSVARSGEKANGQKPAVMDAPAGDEE